MTTIDRTGASDAEFRARVAAFDAAQVPPECDPERVETVARAIAEHTQLFGGAALIGHPAFCSCGWEGAGFARHLAAAAIAALPPSPAEEAVKRRYPCYCLPGAARCDDPYNWCDRVDQLEGVRDRALRMAGQHDRDPLVGRIVASALRAALASPAPAPQGEEPTCYCGRLGHRLGGPILHKRTEACPR